MKIIHLVSILVLLPGGEGNLNIVNNLDKGGSQKSLSYSKNINIDGDGQSRKKPYKDNDNVDLEEMNQLIAQTAKELEIDAQRAIAGLQKDKEIMEKLSEIKRRKKSSQGKLMLICGIADETFR